MYIVYTTSPACLLRRAKIISRYAVMALAMIFSAFGLYMPAYAQSSPNPDCPLIQSVSWEHNSFCGAADGVISIAVEDGGIGSTTYSIDLKFGSKDKTFNGLRARNGVLTIGSLYPGDYSELVVSRDDDGCASIPYERTILIDHGCELATGRSSCGSGAYSPDYYNCEGELLNIQKNNLTPDTYIYTDDDYLACGIAYVDGCEIQSSIRVYCLDYNKTEPTPDAGYPYGTAHFTRVVGAQNAGYTDELAMERINWILCNGPTGSYNGRVNINAAIWYFTETSSYENYLVDAAIAAVPSAQGGIANQMVFYLPVNSTTIQPFIEAACIDTCRPDLTINNDGDCTLEVFLVDNGSENSYGAITNGNSITVSTEEDQVWNIRSLDGSLVESFTVTSCDSRTLDLASTDCHDACNGNVLSNPGFENGLSDWTTTGTDVATTSTASHVFTGNSALILDDPNSSARQTFSLSSLQTFTLTLWAKEAGSSGTYSYAVQYLNTFGSVISTTSGSFTGGSYSEYTLSGLAPLGTRSGRVVLSRNSSTNGNAYFDEVCLTVSEAATETSSVSNWDFSCESNSSVEVISRGPNCIPTSIITIPNSGSVYEYVVEIVYKGSNPGSSIIFTDAGLTNYSLSRTTPVGGSSNVYVYRGKVDGSTSSITYTDLLSSCDLQSIIVYAFRNTGGEGKASSGTFTAVSGYHSSESITVSIPPDFTTRDVTVQVPISEMTNDCRILNITAEAGGVSNTVTIDGSDFSLGDCCLAIPEVTLNNVPATATQITITVESPNGSGCSNGQSFVVAGFVQVETECGDCESFPAGTLSGEEEFCGPYDPTVITGTDVIGGEPSCPAAGSVLLERYDDISGSSVSDLTSASKYPNSPDYTTELGGLFEAPTDIGNNYGVRLSGYLCPPTSGDYTFWIASDDGGELNLSSNSSPGSASTIATVPGWTSPREWDKYSSQQSSTIYLEAGEIYYIEALMKEASGGDNLAVGWQLPDGTLQRPIPASNFSAPSDGNIDADYQWQYRLGTSGTWIDIPGATGTNYDPGEITQTTQYRRVINNDFCGEAFSNEVTKRVYQQPEVTYEVTNATCEVPTGSILLSFADVTGQSNIEFSLDNGASYPYRVGDNTGSFSITGLAPGEYQVMARWGDGSCETEVGLITIELNVNQISVSGNNQQICFGETVELSLSASGGVEPYTYSWSTGDNTPSITVGPGSSTFYNYTVTDDEGCSANGYILVQVDGLEDAGEIAEDEAMCGPYDPAEIVSIADPSLISNNVTTENCCDDPNFNRSSQMILLYTGSDCSASSTVQTGESWSCSGDPEGDPSVYIIANDSNNPGSGSVWFAGQVNQNSTFTIDAANGGASLIRPNLYLHIYDEQGGSVIQTVKFHTSCSVPLAYGDQFGSIRFLTAIGPDNVICSGDLNPLPLNYQWQSRTGSDGTWTDIPGATGATYDPELITETTEYRRGAYYNPQNEKCI